MYDVIFDVARVILAYSLILMLNKRLDEYI